MSGRLRAYSRRVGVVGAVAVVALTIGTPAVRGASPTAPADTTAVSAALANRTGFFVAPAAPLPVMPAPTAAGVASALAAPLADPALGPGVVASVMDPNTGAVLYDSGALTPTIPASSVKILTSAAVLKYLDDDAVLTTRVMQAADGTLIVVGAGDPQLQRDSDGAGASLDLLAALTVQSLRAQASAAAASANPEVSATAAPTSPQPTAPVRVAVDDALFTGPTTVPSWSPTLLAECIVRPITALAVQPAPGAPCQPEADPALAAGEMFAAELAERGVAVTPGVTRAAANTTDVQLAAADSQPVATLVESMMLESDNTAAEMLAHLAGGAAVGQASFAGGAQATAAVVAQLGIPAAGMSLADASGLSREDAVPPATIARMLTTTLGAPGAASTPAETRTASSWLWPVSSGLPVAGFDGTLSNRFETASTAAGRGDVRAKTGTLTGVSALAGQVVTAQGQLLVFVFITPTASDTTAARAALDNAASALANCGCG